MKKNSKQPTKSEKISDVTPYGDFFATYFQNKSEDEKIKILDTLGALMFVMARGFNLYNSMFMAAAKQLRFVHTQERKMYLKMIEDGCDKCRIGLTNFEDWAFNSGITESGHTQDADALDAYLSDGSFFAVLLAHVFNASIDDKESRSQIESLLKEMADKDVKIPYDVIDKVRMK